jgi:hypothetical protein
MALMGLPSGSAGGGDIKPRIEYDAKAGRWHRVNRSQAASGEWITDKTELKEGEMFLMDIAQVEVGWISFGGGQPDFRMGPNGTPVGPRPTEQHKPGFRVSVVLPREDHDRHFASTAKAVLAVIDDLHTKAGAAPAGHVPVIKIAGTRIIETKTPQGTNRNYAPLLEIVKYVPRPAALGDAPSMGVTMAPAAPAPAPQTAPAAKPEPERVLVDDEVPFLAEFR